MEENQFQRTELLIGVEALERLKSAHVAVFGIGGVGGAAAEALVRAGIGAIDLIDPDRVSLTNLNRQILALHSTVGQYKTDAAEARFLDINPTLKIRTFQTLYLPESADQFDFTEYDYIVDAIDNVTGKITLAENAKKSGVPLISSMGTGNKLDPARFEVADLFATSVCPLARVMRYELKRRGIERLKVVYSKEKPTAPQNDGGERVPASISFVPSAAGLILAGEVIRDLIGNST
ncbi:MAG: tRNA threonylcarbamoyladenosine dehydratase [Ruminiclostridium sp.]|nr:tRNA threonylcarbamoyladenosine dehydratase [Ruminiclostridium sp.]